MFAIVRIWCFQAVLDIQQAIVYKVKTTIIPAAHGVYRALIHNLCLPCRATAYFLSPI